MGSQPVIKMLFGISMPIICSMMIQALYNVIDSMYVAHISGNALTAVSIVFPFQMLMIALATGSGAVLNMILDPIMIFGLFGFPKLGVAGAAWATVSSQTVSMLFGFVFHRYANQELHDPLSGFKPEIRVIFQM